MVDQRVGGWAFILGVLIAIVAGIAATAAVALTEWVTVLLIVLGLIVGFLNIGDKDLQGFLIAAIALVVARGAVADLNPILGLGTLVTNIVTQIAAFVAPAALVVAPKGIYNIARKP